MEWDGVGLAGNAVQLMLLLVLRFGSGTLGRGRGACSGLLL